MSDSNTTQGEPTQAEPTQAESSDSASEPGQPGVPTIIEQGVLVDQDTEAATGSDGGGESIEQPGKVMRVGAMMRQLLDELRQTELDESSRDRLREIHETSIAELSSALSPDLHDELTRLALPFDDASTPSEAELLIAKAQIVGWLEGLVQGIQATLFAQQLQAQQQLANMRQIGPGSAPGPGQGRPSGPAPSPGGTYL